MLFSCKIRPFEIKPVEANLICFNNMYMCSHEQCLTIFLANKQNHEGILCWFSFSLLSACDELEQLFLACSAHKLLMPNFGELLLTPSET